MSDQRSNEIDVIRLLALIGICVVNIPILAMPVEAVFTPPEASIDRMANLVVAGFFQLKFFLLFSFAFGWGVHVLQRSALSRGHIFKRRYFRRMIGLAILGALHAVFVFNGDILLPYAILGSLLWFVIDYPVASLLRVSKWMIALSMSCVVLLVVVIVLAQLAGIDDAFSTDSAMGDPGGNYLEATKARIAGWPGSLVFIFLVQGALVFGAFTAGLAAAKSNFIVESGSGLEILRKKLPLLLTFGLSINFVIACSSNGILPQSLELLELIAWLLAPIGIPALTAVYVYLCLRISRAGKLPHLLVMAGRNSLSTYVLQGIIAGFLFGGYGLGLYNTLGHAAILPLSLVIAGGSIVLVGWYATVFGRGPLEFVLRSFSAR